MPRARMLLLTTLVVGGCERKLTEVFVDRNVAPPIIDSFSPTAGLAGQTVVHVVGRNFPPDARVYFGTQQGLWAIGTTYSSTSTDLYAIPPLTQLTQVAVSVRGTTGEAEAGALFAVFDGEPEIVSLSSERLTRDTELTITGRNFNADDREARLYVGAAEVIDFEVREDGIVANIGSAVGFADLGSGWELLRYTHTPYVDGGPSEVAIAVYVLQSPEVVYQRDYYVHSQGRHAVLVRGYDAYHGVAVRDSAGDNLFWLGTQAADIVSVQRFLGEAPEGDPIYEVVLQLPALAPETNYRLSMETAAGTSGYDYENVYCRGRGSLSAMASVTSCVAAGTAPNPFAPSKLIRAPGNGEVAAINIANTGTMPAGSLVSVSPWGGSFSPLFRPGVDGVGVVVDALPVDEWHSGAGYMVAAYRDDGVTQWLNLYWVPAAGGSACLVATAQALLPTTGVWTNPFVPAELTVSLFERPAQPWPAFDAYGYDIRPQGLEPVRRLFVTVAGLRWNAVLELPLAAEDSRTSTCPITPTTLTSRIDVSAWESPAIAWTVDRQGEWLAALSGGTLVAADVSLTASTTDPYVISGNLIPADTNACEGALSLGSATGSVLLRSSSSLCSMGLARQFNGEPTGNVRFAVTTQSPCGYSDNCPAVELSPNEQEAWVLDTWSAREDGPAVGDRVDAVSAQTGVPGLRVTSAMVGGGHLLAPVYDRDGARMYLAALPYSPSGYTTAQLQSVTSVSLCVLE